MAYIATVLRVMIASPSDTTAERDAVEGVLYEWNHANAVHKRTILQPWRWETSSVPLVGGPAQSLINAQGVDEADAVIALFGSRLGSPTAAAVSGTVEEIERAVSQGKPVHLYFSTASLPHDVDVEQLEGLRAFKKEIGERSLFAQFANIHELEREVRRAIERDVAMLSGATPTPQGEGDRVSFLVQPKDEREIRDYDKNGKPRYRTRHWIEITNTGTQDAENVTFDAVGDDPSMLLITDGTPTVIHAGQIRRLNYELAMNGGPELLRINWTQDGKAMQREFHVG